jgi:hypothetical protein
MGPTSAPHTPGICEERVQLECRYKEAEAAFDSARTAVWQEVGRSAKDEYLVLARAVDLAWDRLQQAATELATHIREHGCRVIPEASPSHKPIWWNNCLGGRHRKMACKTCDELLAAYKREVRLFGNAVLKISGAPRDDSRLATQEAAHLLVKCRDANDALMAHLDQDHSNRNEDSDSGARR